MVFEDLHRPLGQAGFKGAVKWIIIITGVILVLQRFFGETMVAWFGLTPHSVLVDHCWWQLVTYLFLHGGVFQWLFNMFVLWMFGRELEVRWGTAAFIQYLLVTGIGAGLCILLLTPHSFLATIGSSGSIFGLLVAFAMVFPEATMYLYFVIPVKAWQAAAIFAVIELFAGIEGGGEGVGRFAHLGGMLTGYLYLRYADVISIPIHQWMRRLPRLSRNSPPASKRPAIELQEITDDLVNQVDRILDKVLKNGPESLTKDEKKIMDKYSRTKH